MAKKKVPKQGAQLPAPRKDVRFSADADRDWSNSSISWHFRYVDYGGPYGWDACEISHLKETIMDRVRSFETMTWRELRSRDLLHTHPLANVSLDAKRRLAEIEQDDVEALVSLRVEKRRRIWGIQDRLYFRVLWWDPEHRVYPMNIANN